MKNEPTIPTATFGSRLRYYLSSVFTLLRGVRSLGAVIQLVGGRPAVVSLHSGLAFKARSLMDVWIIKETCLDGDYESFGVTLQDGWTVVDIGAGLGDFAVAVGHRFPRCRVIALEPFAESFALLQENVVLNGVNNVTAILAAAAATTGTLQLSQTGAAVQHTTQANAAAKATSTPVPAVTLADVMAEHHLERIDFLKIDCEGGEFDILLRSPADILQKIDHIALEYHDSATPHHHRELSDRLSALGFTVSTRPNPVHGDIGLMFAKKG